MNHTKNATLETNFIRWKTEIRENFTVARRRRRVLFRVFYLIYCKVDNHPALRTEKLIFKIYEKTETFSWKLVKNVS